MIRPFRKDEEIERLFPVIKTWVEECSSNEFGIEMDVADYINEVYKLIHLDDCDLLVMEVGGRIIGLMGITCYKSPIGSQKIANAHYWYTLPEHRGKGISFIFEARKWARERDCTHLILNASNMNQLHDKVCQIYQRIGMSRFETAFIEKLD